MLGCLNSCISVVLHGETVKMICLSDEGCIGDPQMLMKLFDENVF